MGNYKLTNLSFICLRLIWLLLLTYVYSVGLLPCPKISSLHVFIFEILTKAVDLCCIKMSDKAAQQMTILPTVTSVWCTQTEHCFPLMNCCNLILSQRDTISHRFISVPNRVVSTKFDIPNKHFWNEN